MTTTPPSLPELPRVGDASGLEPDPRFYPEELQLAFRNHAIVLEGLSRFRLVHEIDVTTAFRQIEADCASFSGDKDDTAPLALALRSDVEREARRFADTRGYAIDWDAVARLDDEALVNAVAQVAPFDVAAKQAVLEAPDIAARADLVAQFLRFFRLDDSNDDATMQ